MVKNAFMKNIFREIKSSLGRYFAMLLIIALGVGFFAGLRLSEPRMRATAVNYFDEYSMYDYRLISTLGFTDEDVESFSSVDGIIANGAYTVDFMVSISDGENIVLRSHSITPDMNKSKLLAGRFPENSGECILDGRYFTEEDIGSYITLSSENSDEIKNTLKYDRYLITGIVSNPYYLNYERGTTSVGTGTVAAYVYIPADGFVSDVWHEIFLKAEISADAYSSDYDKELKKYTDTVDNLLSERGNIRYEKIKTDAEKEISDAEKELSERNDEYESEKSKVEKELSDSLKKLRDSESEIALAKDNIELKEKEISDAEKEISSGLEAIESSKKELEERKNTTYFALNEKEAELYENKSSLEQAIAYYTSVGNTSELQILQAKLSAVNAGLEKIAENRAAVDGMFTAAEKEIKENERFISEKKDKISSGREEIEKAKKEISINENKIKDGYSEYYSGKKEAEIEFEEALKKIDEARTEIDDAKEELSKLSKPSLYLFDRSSNIGYVCFENDSSIIKSISLVFPMFFLLIAILVCMTTMTRMVDECRGQIGIFKALGYSNFKIQQKFIIYSGSAAFVGWLLGFFVGTIAIPELIWKVYGIMYNFADLIYVFDWPMFIICLAAAMLCSCGAAYIACGSELRPLPANLIRPKTPKEGKKTWLEHIPFIWKHLGFLKKVSARNIFRYKSRLFMMVLGIGGCTALLITGFGIRDSIKDVVSFQFEEIMTYDYSVSVSDGNIDDVSEKISSIGGVESFLQIYAGSDDLIFGENQKNVNLLVAENDNFDKFIYFGFNKDEIPFPSENEIIVSTGIADSLNVKVGDKVTLRDGDYNEIILTVSGIFDNYIYNYAVISEETFENGFRRDLKANSIYVKVNKDADVRQISALISDIDGVVNITVNEDLITRMGSTMSSINYIVLLVLVCAAALAFIVIYNLTNINIEERIREIATIKVLGFRKKEVSEYVMREIVVLTSIGAVVGLPLGKILHSFVMSCIKVDLVTFQNKITLLSYVLSLVLTFVFAFIINIFMAKHLDKIDMASSLKSIE